MKMTLTQKILSAHSGLKEVRANQIIESNVDMILGNDITSPVAIKELEKYGEISLFDKSKIALVMDHFVPNKDIKSAQQCKVVRDFAKKHSIKNFFDVGEMGIEHVILPEKGLVGPGDLIIGADSHTCTYGALGAFSVGVGSTDMAAGMITGKVWLRVPAAIKIEFINRPSKWVSGKDIILHIIGKIGVSGARYKSIEFLGEGLKYLSMDDRLCISNMVVEAGAKNGIFPVDDITREYIKNRFEREPIEYKAESDADYCEEYIIDLSEIRPTVAFPHLPENTKTIDEIGNIKIDQVVIGSCTNGRISDLKVAANILNNNKINSSVRCIIIPGSQEVYLEALRLGLIEIFITSGAIVSTPTCGPCLGSHMGVLADSECAISTTNRNFVGRMGHINSKVYLASPAVAAASAIYGYIKSPETLKGE